MELPAWPSPERFVRFIVAGGLALVAGLWLTRLFAARSWVWILGVVLAVTGVVALAVGIRSQIEI